MSRSFLLDGKDVSAHQKQPFHWMEAILPPIKCISTKYPQQTGWLQNAMFHVFKLKT